MIICVKSQVLLIVGFWNHAVNFPGAPLWPGVQLLRMASCRRHGYFCLYEALLHKDRPIYLPRNSSLSSKTLEILRKSVQNKFIARNKSFIPCNFEVQQMGSRRWAFWHQLEKSRQLLPPQTSTSVGNHHSLSQRKVQDKRIIKDTSCQNLSKCVLVNLSKSTSFRFTWTFSFQPKN